MSVARLARVTVNALDAETLAAFYTAVLDFQRVGDADGRGLSLRLGDSRLDIVDVAGRGRRYPPNVAGWSPLFQHCAIVVADMARAMERLRRSAAWTPISVDGPQTLPANTGGVTAFKFRDPEGHPLELLAFAEPGDATPSGPFVRIDHSAISVIDVDRSVAFYEALGLRVTGRSLNVGVAQQRLDGVDDATVDVVALTCPHAARPHLELLAYRGTHDRALPPAQPDDVAATRLVFEVADREALMGIAIAHAHCLVALPDADDGRSATLRDPDGHLLRLHIAR